MAPGAECPWAAPERQIRRVAQPSAGWLVMAEESLRAPDGHCGIHTLCLAGGAILPGFLACGASEVVLKGEIREDASALGCFTPRRVNVILTWLESAIECVHIHPFLWGIDESQ